MGRHTPTPDTANPTGGVRDRVLRPCVEGLHERARHPAGAYDGGADNGATPTAAGAPVEEDRLLVPPGAKDPGREGSAGSRASKKSNSPLVDNSLEVHTADLVGEASRLEEERQAAAAVVQAKRDAEEEAIRAEARKRANFATKDEMGNDLLIKGAISNATREKLIAREARILAQRTEAEAKLLREEAARRKAELMKMAPVWRQAAVDADTKLVQNKWGALWKEVVSKPVKTVGPHAVPAKAAELRALRETMTDSPYSGAYLFILSMITRKEPGRSVKVAQEELFDTLHSDCLQQRDGEDPLVRKHTMRALQKMTRDQIASYVSGTDAKADYAFSLDSVEVDFNYQEGTQHERQGVYKNEPGATFKVFVITTGYKPGHPDTRQLDMRYEGPGEGRPAGWRVRNAAKFASVEIRQGEAAAVQEVEKKKAEAEVAAGAEGYAIVPSIRARSEKDMLRQKHLKMIAKRDEYEKLHPEAKVDRLRKEEASRVERTKKAADRTGELASKLAKKEMEKSYEEMIAELQSEADGRY